MRLGTLHIGAQEHFVDALLLRPVFGSGDQQASQPAAPDGGIDCQRDDLHPVAGLQQQPVLGCDESAQGTRSAFGLNELLGGSL